MAYKTKPKEKEKEAKPPVSGPGWKKIILSTIVFVIVANIVHTLAAFAEMSYYINPANYHLWGQLMVGPIGPPGPEFFAASILFSTIIGLIFASSYLLFKSSIPEGGIGRGANYGLLLFLISTVPYTLTTYLLIAVPSLLLFSWTLENLVVYLICGFAFEQIMR